MAKKKNKEQKLTLKQIWQTAKLSVKFYLKAGKIDMILTSVIRIALSSVPALTAVLSGMAVSELARAAAETRNPWPVLKIILYLLGITLGNNLLQRFCSYREMKLRYKLDLYVDRQIFEKYARVSISTLDSKEFADLFEMARRYGYNAGWVFDQISGLISNVVSFAAAFVAMFIVSPLLAVGVTFAVVPLVIVNFVQANKEREIRLGRTTEWRRGYAIEWALRSTEYALEIKMNGLSKYLVDEMLQIRALDRDDDMRLEREFYGIRWALDWFGYAVEYGTLGYVVWQIVLGKVPVGQFVTIQSLYSNLSGSAQSFLGGFSSMRQDFLQANDFAKFMELPEDASGTIQLDPTHSPRIEFRNVSFKYPNNDVLVLSNIDLVIEPGEDIAIVGENGAGKTTLIKLLIGAYRPTSGAILVNGTPLEDLDGESWMSQLGALFQDYLRYDFATLGDNIWYGDITKKPETSAFDKMLIKAGLDNFAAKFNKGYKQFLSKDIDKDLSVDLSGGQWQRLALARGFFRNANVLILDEPTAAVDAKAEYKIFQEIIEQQKDKTTIIISHRFSTVRKAGRILVLDRGKIVENGTHAELMAVKDGLYREMFELQAEGYL